MYSDNPLWIHWTEAGAMICRHRLKDVQDHASTVWGDSRVTLGSKCHVRSFTHLATSRAIP